MGIEKQTTMKKILLIVTAALCLAAAVLVCYFFHQESVDVGGYTVVYYNNLCDVDSETLPTDFESLKNLPCLIRITWTERIASDMEQEYCYLPDRGIEKTRLIHKTK